MSALPVSDLEPALRPIRVTPLPDRTPAARPVSPYGKPDPRQGVLTLVREEAPAIERPLPRRRRRDEFGPVPTATADLPDARAWAAWLAPALLQVASGARPAPQVMRHVDAPVYESLVRRHSRALRTRIAARRPIRIRTTVAAHPADGVAEVSVVVDDADRIRALAMRFEGLDGRWVLTALQIG